ncbi:hypothetical protein ABMA28_005287 [Loxostege sticticalis]|uniref:BEN domain-containing protein n=1 Tax=Loxostege sticticalis TaxID=481309 RepID=A0ABD0SPW6_LOXSC
MMNFNSIFSLPTGAHRRWQRAGTAYLLKTINWNVFKIATRRLKSVFGRRVLDTHNFTGKVSPAFPDRMPKAKLDEALVNDIVQTVAERCNVPDNIVQSPSETGTRKCQHTLRRP